MDSHRNRCGLVLSIGVNMDSHRCSKCGLASTPHMEDPPWVAPDKERMEKACVDKRMEELPCLRELP